MTDRNTLVEKLPHNLQVSITNLWDKLGQSQNILVGLAINLLLALTGVAVVLWFSNPVISAVGAGWAAINLLGIIKWVFGL